MNSENIKTLIWIPNFILMLFPSLILLMVTDGSYSKVPWLTIAILISVLIVLRGFTIYKRANGFFTNWLISFFIINIPIFIIGLYPEDEDVSDFIMKFVFIPGIVSTIYILLGTKSGKKLVTMYTRAYNKPFKQDK